MYDTPIYSIVISNLVKNQIFHCFYINGSMTLLNILEFPDTRLRTTATPVDRFGDDLRRLVEDMFETMYAASGIGLAATQVNIHKQVIVVDISENQSDPHVIINPKLTILDATPEEYNEGCLSVPGFYERIKRPHRVQVDALDVEGKLKVIKPEGLLSVCIQHEVDHLNGKLFVDHISLLKRQKIRKQLEKQHRLQS